MTGKPTRSRTKQFLIDFLLAAHDPLLSLLALLPNLRPGILSAAPLDRLVILRSLSSVSFPRISAVMGGTVAPARRSVKRFLMARDGGVADAKKSRIRSQDSWPQMAGCQEA